MRWYEDESLWSDFSSTMFPARRRDEVARLVDASPLLAFGAGARVLDLGCGPGVLAVPLARRGDAVTGVDLSAAMLEGARKALADAGAEAELVRADMLEFVRPEAFDVVLNVFTSFGYFDDHGDNVRVLRNAHDSLVPGGRLLIDVMGKEVLAGWIGRPQVVDLDDGYVIQRDTVLDSWRRLRTDWTLVRGGTAREASIHCWLYSAAELCALFEEAGFTAVECFGGFDASPYGQTSRRLIVRGTRPHPG
ncbi:class I SAM-dependent methyltransferase [Streptomyces radicis]|uniref:Class I SAM-dependent methyltransferase n=1 Tax=Streptomyces radicis TaxID=1750517 RepID=A0A3A9VVG7_9ACTN|nr:class I SAM-dependent methyltransferase [Streptomyces radicis]RKN04750.1 class I SAM-dependent methyltransferase [Streptomyces radicis]RKN15956.1 class I SAM-dependent methyltransferase [Streptomyces radicis]